ncbi:MAG: hypothetical protein GTN76_06235, partial [Candidatus Aenigmarchaeota archaeon]|nr:hypothetical protein [Candidatus Aenigmarchaeota archaeon]
SRLMSIELAEKRGSFPNFKGSIWEEDYESMRNATTTTIAPTGTLSLIADCSCGIEPLFVLSFVRNFMGGTRLLEVNPLFEVTAWREGFHRDELMAAITRHGSIKDFKEIPSKIRKLFVTA